MSQKRKINLNSKTPDELQNLLNIVKTGPLLPSGHSLGCPWTSKSKISWCDTQRVTILRNKNAKK